MYNGLYEFVKRLEQAGELIRIKEKVSPVLEIAEITDRISKQKFGGKALLFENTGTQFPVVTNLMGSERRIAMALEHQHIEQIAIEIEKIFIEFLAPKNNLIKKIKTIPKIRSLLKIAPETYKGKAACQEIIIKQPDLNLLPILKTWPEDGDRFITLPLVHTKDPFTGIRNVGMYRMQVLGRTMTAMHWHKHKTGARHFKEYKKMKRKMPVAVVLGGDPIYTYVATAPLPDNFDEYLLAGFIRKEPVKLVKAITQDIEVPADADFVIEGYIDPEEDFALEGPFGDHTGFYSQKDYYPKFHVTCITHRKNAIFPATLVGIPPQEDAYFAKVTERIFLPLIRNTFLPELIDMDIPVAGVGHNFTIVRIKKDFEGHANKVMNTLWGAGQLMFNKFMFVVSSEILDIHNYRILAKEALKNYSPETDTNFFKGTLDILDHSSGITGLGSKLGMDLTQKIGTEKKPTNKKTNFDKQLCKEIKKEFQEIKDINYKLLDEEIPVIILTIEKQKKVNFIAEDLIHKFNLTGIKILIWIDSNFDIKDYFQIMWITGNNVDPQRDAQILFSKTYENFILSLDATEKTKETDNYPAQWPKITVMNKETIETVDKKWKKYGFEKFIPSPSLKFLEK